MVKTTFICGFWVNHLKIHVPFQRMFSQQISDDFQRFRQCLGQRSHGRALCFSVQNGGTSRQTFSPKPQLPRQIFLHHVIWKFHPEVPISPALGYELVHYLVADGQDFVLAMSQLIDEGRASLWLLSAVERVQLAGHPVERLVGVKKLSQQTRVISLQENRITN